MRSGPSRVLRRFTDSIVGGTTRCLVEAARKPAGRAPELPIPSGSRQAAAAVARPSLVQRVIPVTSPRATTTLWRPTGPKELELVRALDWRAWPPRLPEQPIFYPVLNEDYAVRIARDWNVKHDGAGFVTRFDVDSDFVRRYPVRQAGGRTILELWVPAEELDEFNAHIVGGIQVVHEFHAAGETPAAPASTPASGAL
ncbi:hypothetical protein GCM10010372_06630 [Streptomyces tauricus]|nr:hypothetical protein GCM10010372_06630 [Streptomyces tauricus]